MIRRTTTEWGWIPRLWIGAPLTAVLVAGLLSPFGLHRDVKRFRCSTCLSTRQDSQWFLGEWSGPSIPVSPRRQIIVDSVTLGRFTPQPHQHEWRFSQGSPYFLFGMSRGYALGAGRHVNRLADSVEEISDQAVPFLSRKLAAGELSTNQLYQALISPVRSEGEKSPLSSAKILAGKLLDEFSQEK